VRKEQLRRKSGGAGEQRHERGHPRGEEFVDLTGLAVEGEDRLEVLLETAGALDVLLQARRRGRIGDRVSLLLPIGQLAVECGGEATIEGGCRCADPFIGRSDVAQHGVDRCLRVREHVERSHADVLVGARALDRHLLRIIGGGLEQLQTRERQRGQRGVEPAHQEGLRLDLPLSGAVQPCHTTVPPESLARLPELLHEEQDASADPIDGHRFAGAERPRLLQPRERLKLIPWGTALDGRGR
jgi:hypothetical protein